MIQLSQRLTAVARLVTHTGTLADVGTDHGYIPVFLTGEKRVRHAIAMDVNQGPLLRAQKHIIQYGMEQQIETRLSDGLAALLVKEADSIVIAGMGGSLMKRILEEGRSKAFSAKELILQPQSELPEFRRFLWQEGYEIKGEDMVLEEGKYYPMMRAVPGTGKQQPLSQLSFLYGAELLECRHPVLKQYLKGQKQQKERILVNLKKHAVQETGDREQELEQELENISRALALYE